MARGSVGCRDLARGAAALAALAILAMPAVARGQSEAARAARQWRQQHERAIIDEFVGLLKIPNVAADRANIQRNADAIVAMLQRRGVAARTVAAAGGNPVVVGHVRTPGATRTIGFYAHYDGQPLDPAEWGTPPFQPTLRDKPVPEGGRVIPLPPAGQSFDPEWRLYARGAADDKAPIVALVTALDGLRAAGIAMKSNITFAFDGEEEGGSPTLEAAVAANKDLFAADVWLMCDAPVYQTRQQSVIFGARGVTLVDITVYGARSELHSGHYGNWAPNPALSLARLLSTLKDDAGRVQVAGFYDDVAPLGEAERRALAELPSVERELMREFWLGAVDGAGRSLNELITEPSLNIRGMASSRVGAQASNVIPATATATLDVRMVKGMDGGRTGARIAEHVRKQGYHVVNRDPTPEERRRYPKVAKVVVGRTGVGLRTPMDLPIAKDVVRAVESARGPVVRLPTMGGGLPLEALERPLGVPTLIIPIGNHDNNQHSFDENLRLQNLWDGVELMAALLTM